MPGWTWRACWSLSLGGGLGQGRQGGGDPRSPGEAKVRCAEWMKRACVFTEGTELLHLVPWVMAGEASITRLRARRASEAAGVEGGRRRSRAESRATHISSGSKLASQSTALTVAAGAP